MIRLIDRNDLQRVGVVDQAGHFLGLISNRDLLIAFSERHPGIWDYFVSKIPFTERGRRHQHLQQHLELKTAGEIMNTNIVTVQEDAPIDAALQLMLERAIKRLPVVDAEGNYKAWSAGIRCYAPGSLQLGGLPWSTQDRRAPRTCCFLKVGAWRR